MKKKQTSPDPLSIFLMGATASGKSEIALKLAEKFDGEIINADSMQVYRGLNIGTAKPSSEEMSRIKHHLINILDISEKLNAFTYRSLAETTVCEIRKRGKIPIFVGGSGLYLKLLIDKTAIPPSNPLLAKQLAEQYSGNDGFMNLSQFLEKRNPEIHRKTYPNHRRMLRAAELIMLGENPTIKTESISKNKTCESRNLSFFLIRQRNDLKNRIIARTDWMLENGWLQEAETMIKKGLFSTPTARQSLGYRSIAKNLAGHITFDAMREEIISATYQLARKQESWFKNKHLDAIHIHLPEDEKLLFEILKNEIATSILYKDKYLDKNLIP